VSLCGCGRGRSAAAEDECAADGVANDEVDAACRDCSSGLAASKVRVSHRHEAARVPLFEHTVTPSWFTFHLLTYLLPRQ